MTNQIVLSRSHAANAFFIAVSFANTSTDRGQHRDMRIPRLIIIILIDKHRFAERIAFFRMLFVNAVVAFNETGFGWT